MKRYCSSIHDSNKIPGDWQTLSSSVARREELEVDAADMAAMQQRL
jgi:hypothetical protein